MKRVRAKVWIGLMVLALTGAGCDKAGPKPSGDPDANEGDLASYSLVHDMLPEDNLDVDILFVIDNSGSMAEEQASLIEWAEASLFGVLEVQADVLPNLHVAVVSTDLGAGPYGIAGCSGDGDGGTMHNQPRLPDCVAPADRFLVDLDDGAGGRTRNYEGTLAEAFSCIAPIGINGCGFEQPLAAMKRALDGSVAANDGFLREDALLAVVFVTDEDDCSVTDTALFDSSKTDPNGPLGALSSFRCFEFGVACAEEDPRAPGARTDCRATSSPYMAGIEEYADFLKGLKSDPSMVIVGGIYGDPDTVAVTHNDLGQPQLAESCASAAGQAFPAVRMQGFLDQFPGRNRAASICTESMNGPLEATARLVGGVATRSPCLQGPVVDLDPDTAGLQFDCKVFDAVAPGTSIEARTELAPCGNGAGDCFTLAPAPAECGHTPSQLAVRIERGAAPVGGTHVLVECRTR